MINFHIINSTTSRLVKHVTLVFTGNILAAFLGFISVLFVSRELSVSDFGLFNLSISCMLIASRLSSLGMDTTMMRFIPSYLAKNKSAEATQIFRVTLCSRFLISSLFSITLFNMAEWISINLFGYPNLAPLLKSAAFGIITLSILNHLKSALNSYQQYDLGIIAQLTVDIGRLFIVIVLLSSSRLDTFTAITLFAFTPLVGALIGLVRFHRELIYRYKPLQDLLSTLIVYSRWLFVSSICGLTTPFVGVFMLTMMLNSESAGIYSLALTITYIFPIINYSLHSVLLPEVSRFDNKSQLKRYVTKSLKISFYIGVCYIPFLFFSEKFILLFFGSRYIDAIPVINWLLIGNILFTMSYAIRLSFLSMNIPLILALVDLFKLATTVIGCFLLIPVLGLTTPAIIALFLELGLFAFLSVYALKKINGSQNLQQIR